MSVKPNELEAGFALVITLGCLLLVTILVVALLSGVTMDRQISRSSSGQLRAEEIAQTAIDSVLQDLLAEAEAGSESGSEYDVNDQRLLQPSEPLAAVPARIGTSDDLPSLVRTSSRDYDPASSFPYPAAGGTTFPPNRASPVSTAVVNPLNQRFISGRRWNLPMLMDPGELGATSQEALIEGQSYGSFTPPDWIFVTRGGPRTISAWNDHLKDGGDPDNFVIGRYAYAIHDVGGLLDLNLAGAPADMSREDIGRKGSVALADLEAIGLQPNQINELVEWRNGRTSDAAEMAAVTFPQPSSHPILKHALNPALSRGFTRVVDGDQNFVNRQDLLGYFDSNGLPEDSLRHLTTFSRDRTAPVWRPGYDASEEGGNDGPDEMYAYRTQSGVGARSLQRNLANVRFTRSGTVAATPNLPQRSVEAGDFLFENRFPLRRLEWIGHNGPANGGTDGDILRAFGLRWNGEADTWVYTSPDSNALATQIKTLDEVAQIPREPDFFEILQAVILNGSLGLAGTNADDPQWWKWRTGADTRWEDGSKYRHVMQIGANIIDQYDADSWPTFLEFNFQEDGTARNYDPSITGGHMPGDPRLDPSFGLAIAPGDSPWEPHVIAGTEDIPYISQVGTAAHRRVPADPVQLYFPIELWNPHRIEALVGSGGRPEEVRIHVRTGQSNWRYAFPTTPPLTATNPRNFDESPVSISVTLTPARMGDLRNPTMLTSANSSGGTVDPVSNNPGGIVGIPGAFSTGRPTWGHRFPFAPHVVDGPSNAFLALPLPPTIELQLRDAGGRWRTYQKLPAFSNFYLSGNVNGTNWSHWHLGSGLIDPRSSRFGTVEDRRWMYNASLMPNRNTSGWVDSYAPRIPGSNFPRPPSRHYASDLNYLGGPVFYGAYSENIDSNDASVRGYTDLDGIRRPGDGNFAEGVYPLAAGATNPDRPFILNRPFRSVGELGYVFRDLPWKTLDFQSELSADSGLLDVFSIQDERLMATKLNLNTRSREAVEAVLLQSLKVDVEPGSNDSYLTEAEAGAVAESLVDFTSTRPLLSRSELATEFLPVLGAEFPEWTKTKRESVIRALAELGTTRTWNFLIDIIAQSGRFPQSVTASTPGALSRFVVEGERRYWVHVAIDRYTGEILDQKLEVVTE